MSEEEQAGSAETGMAALRGIQATVIAASTGASKAARKRAYRAAMVAQKTAILAALRAKNVRTTGASVRSSAYGSYGCIYLADYDKPARHGKPKANSPAKA